MATVEVLGLPQIAKKLDQVVELTDARAIVQEVGQFTQRTLLGMMPTSWHRPRQISLMTTQDEAVISLPRIPYVFLERGSAYPKATGEKRPHRKRRAAGQILRIKPRRYIRRTKAKTARELRRFALERGRQIERAFG